MHTTLKPFSIGPVRVEMPVILAAMAGYTDLPYRLLCREHGARFTLTEMMLDRMITLASKVQRRMMLLSDGDHPVAGQIIGSDPADVAGATAELCRRGFDVIDLNMACPVHKAMTRRRGGYMMSQPDKVLEVVRAATAAADRPVTLKLRQKFKAADGHDAFWRIAEGAFDAGVAAICVHARSVEAKYTGPADWSFLAEVKRRFADRTIIGSGDVLTPEAALRMLSQTGVDGVAAARGALGNPWFFRQVCDIAAGRQPYEPTLAEQRELIRRHFDHVCQIYGDDRGPKIMRKFGIRYARMHPRPKDVRIAFVAVKRPSQWHDVLDRLYDEQAKETICTPGD